MASTNKTTHYELSQFLGTDKPAWLSDYNSDMQKIDTGINSAQTTATGADGKADANTTSIGTLENLTTTSKTSLVSAINEVDSHADGATESASNANTIANAAKTVADNLATYLDINNVNSSLTFTASGGCTIGEVRYHSAYNTAGTLGKIYGFAQITKTNSQDSVITISDTGLRPTTPFTISDGAIIQYLGDKSVFTADLVVSTNGTATVTIPGWIYTSPESDKHVRIISQPYLIFAKKFDA